MQTNRSDNIFVFSGYKAGVGCPSTTCSCDSSATTLPAPAPVKKPYNKKVIKTKKRAKRYATYQPKRPTCDCGYYEPEPEPEPCNCGCHEPEPEPCDCGCGGYYYEEEEEPCDCGCYEEPEPEPCDCGCYEPEPVPVPLPQPTTPCNCGCHEPEPEPCNCGCYEVEEPDCDCGYDYYYEEVVDVDAGCNCGCHDHKVYEPEPIVVPAPCFKCNVFSKPNRRPCIQPIPTYYTPKKLPSQWEPQPCVKSGDRGCY